MLATIVLGAGCDERERLTFPTLNDSIGPVTTIEQPEEVDTTVSAGAVVSVVGATVDQDGVDTVHFLVGGGNHSFPPFSPLQPETTIRFSLPLVTSGFSGSTFEVQIYGVDALGNRGGTSTRLIHIR